MNQDQRVAYLEARVGELASTIGALRAEIVRLRREVEFEANAVQTGGEWFGFEEPRRVCCCLTPEGAALVAADPRWKLPQCSVHPDTDARLLAVAEARAAVDTGERHDLDDVAREFGVDLDEDVSVHPDRGGNDER